MHVEGETCANLSVEIGRHVDPGNFLDQKFESRSDVEFSCHLIGVQQAFQKHIHLLLGEFVEKD